MYAIEITDLRKSYSDKEVLHGIGFNVERGQMVGFLGPNGAGKSTTIRILLGLIRATSGTTRLFGDSTAVAGQRRRRAVGYLPGELRLYPSLTGRATVEFLARVRRVDCRQEIARLATVFELDLRGRVRNYSSGMKQKLGLIQALMHKPQLVIMDEPTTGLDPLVRQTLFAELQRVAQDNRTVLFSSHILSEVSELCDQVVMLRQGTIVENQSIRQLRLRAVRRVDIVFSAMDEMPSTFPTTLQILERSERRLSFTWSGSIDSLLQWLNVQSLDDVTIGKPSLEELFLTYYRE